LKRSGFQVMARLVGLVKPLTGYMILAIIMGLIGHLCAAFITVFGGYAVLHILYPEWHMNLSVVFSAVLIFAAVRGFLRYAEQACNHFIAFKLLALIRDKVFGALRRLCPAKLEGKDKGNLINIITSDIELLEVFYAHTISPICIATLFCAVMVIFIGSYHIALGVLALAAYITVGVIIPLLTSKLSGEDGMKFRTKSGELASFVLDSLRGLSETLQYRQGEQRMSQMNKKTEELS
jgi:ABC-type transport system involved in cytochrome bd biosynthesis fused ATPase/permease subunit